MRITAYLTEDAIQFNLEPGSEHERKFLALLMDYQGGEVSVRTGVDISRCQGGYLREFDGKDKTVAVTIYKKTGDNA